jgi:hypothetical protein
MKHTDKQLESARNALQVYESLQRKNCLAYEFVMLKLGCGSNKASALCREIYRQREEDAKK